METTNANFWELVEKIFFEALLAGYAGSGDDPRVTKTSDFNGLKKKITFFCGDFIVIDQYFVTLSSDYSAGSTVIHFKGSPVWCMHYGGFYPKSTIPFLKEALSGAYSSGKFIGGRGPGFFSKDTLAYYNFARGNFKKFRGHEEIREVSFVEDRHCETVIGEHVYFGMKMV